MNTRPANLLPALLAGLILGACGGGGGGGGGGGDSTAAPVSPTYVGRFAYVANFNDGTVSMYTVDAATGQLRHNGYVAAGNQPHSVAVHPSGRFVYVSYHSGAALSGAGLSGYAVGSDGRLNALPAPIACNNCGTRGLTIDPSGKFLYVAHAGASLISAYAINADGTLSFIADNNSVVTPFSVTIDPAGRFAYVTSFNNGNVHAFAIQANGSLLSVDTDAATAGNQAIFAGNGTHAFTFAPAGRFAYTANFYDGTVSAYTVDASSGALTSVGAAVTAGDNPRSVAVDPSGRFAYVANYGSANVSAYAINATSGALTALAGSQFTVGANPSSVSVDPSGKFLYVTSSGSNDTTVFTLDAPTGLPIAARTVAGRSGSLEMAMTKGTTAVRYTPKFAYVGNPAGAITAYTISATDGALTVGASAAIGGSVSSIAVDPSARFAYVANQSANNISIFNIDSASGNLTTTVGPEPTGGTSPQSVIVDPSGRFAYVVNADSSGTVSAYTIGATNGALTRIDADPTSPGIQNFAAGAYPRSAAVDPAGRFLYAANSSSNTVSVYAIDASTGTLTAAGPAVTTGASSAPSSITVDPTGRFAYVANGLSNTVSVFRIDPASGALTAMGSPVASGGNGAGFITVDPSGRFVYVTHPITWSDGAGNVIAAASNDVSVFTIDPASGALMAVGSPVATGAGPYSMAVELSGRFTYVASNGSSNVSMYRINDTSGELTAFGVPLSSQYAVSVTTTGTIE